MRRITVMVAIGAALSGSALTAQAGPSANPAEVTLGKRVFLNCMACHAVEPGASGKIGPNLGGVVGRPAGSLPAYHYSAALVASRIVWTPANLDLWLQHPARLVPGTTMTFAGLPEPTQRRAVIAYLQSVTR